MDHSALVDMAAGWLHQYGSLSLFVLLALGIIAFPVPEETLMVVAGVFMANGTLPIDSTIFAALAGSISGITGSYLIGRTAGLYVLTRYGGWAGITNEHIDKAHAWFERYGKWSLVFGYFIPGIRHFTGVSAGAASLKWWQFCLFAYSGAVLWVSTFLSLGYFFGHSWMHLLKDVKLDIDTIFTVVLLLFAVAAAILLHMRLKKHPQ